uniref:Solute carrier organic anion transporter family member n=1 Tax=Ciona intestinalis TaxID=7719 RepID=F6ZVK8_CIOIN
MSESNRTDILSCTATVENGQENQDCSKRGLIRKKLLSIQAFVAFVGIALCGQSALATYNKSVLTSIEKRFGIASSLAGFIAGAFNIGNLLFVVAVSKLSSKYSRPRFIAVGSLIIAAGGLINAVPHFIHGVYEPSATNLHFSNIVCFRNTTANVDTADCTESSSEYPYLFIILVLGQILEGIGATVHIPLGSSYIDDYASTYNSPLYLGTLFVLQNFGSGSGYLMGSWTSNVYVDFEKVRPENYPVSKDDEKRWVGAWWLGFLIIGIFVIFTSIPIFFFPKSMNKQEDKKQKNSKETPQKDSNDTEVKNIPYQKMLFTDFIQTICRLVTNPLYVLVILSYSGLMFVVGSVSAFLPKYLEISYKRTASEANLMFGKYSVAIPAVMTIGLFSGGLLTKKTRWGEKALLRYIVAIGTFSPLLFLPNFFMGCSFEVISCIYIYYISLYRDSILLNYIFPCCFVRQNLIDQLLSLKSNMFLNFSWKLNFGSSQMFQGCGDTPPGFNVTSEIIELESIKCDCDFKAKIFVALMATMTLLLSTLVTPIYTVLLRCVDKEDKTTGVAVMFLGIRALGLIPAPIITGMVIDGTCLRWSDGCSENRHCLEYDIIPFR